MTIFLRPSRAVFRFAGPDAQKLLEDVVTGPVAAAPGPARWFALLSPQGKIQAEGLLGWTGGAFWLDVHRDVADAFFKRMRMYRLRASVEIDDLRETYVAGWSAEPASGGIAHDDVRAGGLGTRVIAEKTAGWAADEAPFAAARIECGIAELGPDFASDTTFPHDIGMDFLDGVDFKKGCYVGQEVVSRMQHRGTARRRPVIVSGVDAQPGTAVLAGELDAGAIGTAVGGKAVASLRLDRISDPLNVTVGDKPVTLTLPAWASYAFGESAAAD